MWFYGMNKREFKKIRQALAKTQQQLAQLLGVSIKAVQSFEQGWRRIPVHVERHVLYLFMLQQPGEYRSLNCWNINGCSDQQRQHCPAWEFRQGNNCWFINGTVCRGASQGDWDKKMAICRRCQFFRLKMMKL